MGKKNKNDRSEYKSAAGARRKAILDTVGLGQYRKAVQKFKNKKKEANKNKCRVKIDKED